MTITVIAHWRTSADSLPAILASIPELRAQSLAEPGCLGYEVLQSIDDPTELVLIERYRDREAIDAHQSSAHYQSIVVSRVRPLLTDRSVELLRSAP